MIVDPGTAPAIARVDTPDPVIFLGIDDGLTRDAAVLDYLEKHRLPFVAFLNRTPLESDPAYWLRARAIGGTIQAHTLTHPNLTKVSAGEVRREVCGSADLIQQVTGTRPTLFRPPYGAYNDTVRAIATECGFIALAMWKGTTSDGRLDLQEHALQAGDILLLHWRPDLLANLKQVVAVARFLGLRVARLEDYLQPLP
jgi:peptidoglycan/xylan/chitin deacetylase (PgdA/CDA1 family)